MLLARLAVDTRYQGSGLGKVVLFEALERLFRSSMDIGFEVIVVDAHDDNDDAARFYLKRTGEIPSCPSSAPAGDAARRLRTTAPSTEWFGASALRSAGLATGYLKDGPARHHSSIPTAALAPPMSNISTRTCGSGEVVGDQVGVGLEDLGGQRR